MERGVIQQSIEGMGTSDDMSLWLVASFSELASEARKMGRQREKQQQKTNQWGFLTCRLCLHFTWLTCRLCLQLIHTCLSINAAFVCTLILLIAVFLTIYYLFSIILATCFRPGFFATCSN